MSLLSGVQFFPVTPFDESGKLALDPLAQHISAGLSHSPGAIFAACGTGEFHTLSANEHRQVIQTVVDVTDGQVPVIASTGGSLGTAIEMAQQAKGCGAAGLLLLPPYLVGPSQPGMVAYARAVAESVDLPIIVYNRTEYRLEPAAAGDISDISNVAGLKDGLGNLDLLTQIMVEVSGRLAKAPKPFQYFNGTPTAETSALAYRGIGINVYSSAVFAFAPDISTAFYQALTAGDQTTVWRLLTDFFGPFARLRSAIAGGAISVVKAGVRLSGIPVGGVRPPLLDPSAQMIDELAGIIAAGRESILSAV